jgi:hypothetical protein
MEDYILFQFRRQERRKLVASAGGLPLILYLPASQDHKDLSPLAYSKISLPLKARV